MARMSSPIIRRTIAGIIPAMTMFIESHSGISECRSAVRYEPPIMSFMKNAWKMNSPNAKPAAYSTMRSIHIGKPMSAVTVAARMIPVASPATQWIVDPRPCFQSGATKRSCVPGRGSLLERT